jgi:hypothetical protein
MSDMAILGWIDRVDDERVAGWVHSHEHPSRSERVEVVINGVPVLQVLAQKERRDLRDRQIPFTHKGFDLTLADFTERAANVIEFVHVESGIRIGSERYTVLSAQPERWASAAEADVDLARSVFAADRGFYDVPTAGSWDHEPNFAPLARAVLQAGRSLPDAVSFLQVEAPSVSFANALASNGRLGRLGVAEPVERLRGWLSDASQGLTRLEFHDSIADAGRPWDIVLMPMLHERSGPRFLDVLERAAAALSDRGLAVFDIRRDAGSECGYLMAHGNRLLRVSTVAEATAEAERAGFKVLEALEFTYVPARTETSRTMLIAARAVRRTK